MSSLPSSPLTGGVSAPTVTRISTIKFGQAMIQPVTFAQPTMDYPFFKKPVSTNVPTPWKGWRAPIASSSPLLKELHPSPPDTPDLTKSLTDQSVFTKDDGGDDGDDRTPAPGRADSSNIRDICKGSKQQESPPTKKAWTEDLGTQKLKSHKASHTLRDEWGKCEESRKGLEYKEMRCLTFAPVTELEQFIFEKCSFDQPPISHPSPLWALDKPSLSSKSTYSETTRWLQQSQSNIDHFWKKDMALVKALSQYHFTSNILEGQTQWKFQKSWILHKVLNVIAINMESMKGCLDFHDSTPVDQGFRHQDLNLCQLKAMAIKGVAHLTMIHILDEDHTHYSDAFGNIFEGGALCKKHFPEGLSGIKTRKGGAVWAIVYHFCPHACSNDDYAYCHLAAIHLNIQWGCGTCYGYISRYLSKVRERVQSHHKKSSREQSCSSCKKGDGGKSDSSLDGISSNDKWSAEEFEEEEEDNDDDEESGSYDDEVSLDASNLE